MLRLWLALSAEPRRWWSTAWRSELAASASSYARCVRAQVDVRDGRRWDAAAWVWHDKYAVCPPHSAPSPPIRTAIRMLRFHACCTRVRMPHAHAHSARSHKRACELPMLRICVLVSFQAFVQVCKEEAGSAREGGGREGMRERRVCRMWLVCACAFVRSCACV